jgi:hypothetical protein
MKTVVPRIRRKTCARWSMQSRRRLKGPQYFVQLVERKELTSLAAPSKNAGLWSTPDASRLGPGRLSSDFDPCVLRL